jgi:tetratricopeptide (TPR) repeat protein
MLRMTFIVLGAVVTWLSSDTLPGQTPEGAAKLRHARAFEQAGDLERAASLYGELWRADPANPVFFEGYQRLLVQLKEYDQAITLIRSRLNTTPHDITLRGSLGTVYYRAGREKEAQEIWESALTEGPPTQQRYRIIAGVLGENRLLDRAADVYRRGRVALGDEQLFTLELAQLLALSMDYRGATVEYLRWLQRNPAQISFVQSRLGAFTWKDEGRRVAIGAVQEALRQGDNLRLHELLAWLYLEGKQFDLALEITRTIDRASHARGNTLYTFAERAYREGAFSIAATAYDEAASVPLAGTRLAAARYGYALAISELEYPRDEDSELAPAGPSGDTPPRAIAAFRRVIEEYPRTEYAARALYQIGRLLFEEQFDLDGAIDSFRKAAQEFAGPGPLRHELALRTGQVLLAKGDTAEAAKLFTGIARAPDALPDQSDEASFRIAELEYFACRFDSALALLNAITVNPRADFANDALEMKAFLQEQHGAGDEPLQLMARADLLARRHAFTEAAAMALEITRRFPVSPTADDALLRAAGWQNAAGQASDAVSTYDRLMTEYRETSPLLDRALFRLAQLYETSLLDRGRALSAYERFLNDFPNSVLLAEARRHVRRLRGEVL